MAGGEGHPMGGFAAASIRVRLSKGQVPEAGRICSMLVNWVMLL